jgi:hypothetical protein
MLYFVANMAVEGLAHSKLSAADRADLFEGLSIFLPKCESERAKYTATCARESERAQGDFLTALEIKKGGRR